MPRKQDIYTAEKLETIATENEDRRRELRESMPVTRIKMLREIITRLEEIRDDIPLHRGHLSEVRRFIEDHIAARYGSNISRLDLAVRREPLIEILKQLYHLPADMAESPQVLKLRKDLLFIELNLLCDPETDDELAGVYLRMVAREERLNNHANTTSDSRP